MRKHSLKFGVDFNIEPAWCAWFSGLVDGEGCFSIRANQISASAELKITLREDDAPIIQDLASVLKCGMVHHMSNQAGRDKGGLGADGIMFRVVAINEVCHIVIPLLDEYPLRTRKRNVYSKFREAAFFIQQGRHHYNGKREAIRLKNEVSALGKFSETYPISTHESVDRLQDVQFTQVLQMPLFEAFDR